MLAALCCAKGDPAANLAAHEEVLRQAGDAGCQLAVFPEMSLSGSADPATHPEWLLGLDSAPVRAMTELTRRHPVAAVFGLAERGEDGRPFITQVFAQQGRLAGTYRKRHLGDGEEAFTPGTEPALLRLGRVSFGIAICAEGGVDYPFDEPAGAGAGLILFCAAPGLYGRRTDEASWRRGHAWWESCGLADTRRHAARTRTWVALATQAGSTVDEDFPGIAALVDPAGQVVTRLPDWRPGTLIVDVPLAGRPGQAG
jgi:predicted amidohydrolase